MQVSEAVVAISLPTKDKGDDLVTVRFDIRVNEITFLKKDKVLFTLSACSADEACTYLKKVHKATQRDTNTMADTMTYAGGLGSAPILSGLGLQNITGRATA